MNNQPSLLTPTTPAVSYPRADRRERAYAKANPLIMALYEKAVRTVTVPFVAAEITSAFEAAYGKLDIASSRGLGGLYADLQKRGIIRKTDNWRPRKNGCPAAEYVVVKAI